MATEPLEGSLSEILKLIMPSKMHLTTHKCHFKQMSGKINSNSYF